MPIPIATDNTGYRPRAPCHFHRHCNDAETACIGHRRESERRVIAAVLEADALVDAYAQVLEPALTTYQETHQTG